MSKYLTRGKTYHAGFTMTELITVMVIVGIMGAAIIPRFFERNSFDSRGFYDQVISTLRYAQKTAIAQHRFVCVAFTTNSIDLTYGSNSDCTVAPTGAVVSHSGTPYPLTSAHATFTPTPVNISFDCLGRPNSIAVATGVCGNTLAVLTASRTVQVTNAASITIEAETGYVH
jgi:MSHA pilin protein MshC